MSAASSSASSSTMSAACSGLERGERLLRVLLLRHLDQGLARDLRRQRLHRGDALVVVEGGEHVGEVGRLQLGGAAGERLELPVAGRARRGRHEPLASRSATSLTWRVPAARPRAAAPERTSSRSTRVGEACSTSNSRPRHQEALAGDRDPAGQLDQQAADRSRSGRRAARPRSAPRSPRGTCCRRSRARRCRLPVAAASARPRRRSRPRWYSSRSSSVTMPAVPPYSSSTTAMSRRSRCMSTSRSPQARLAGAIATGRTGSGAPGSSLKRSNACSMPTISSSVPRYTGSRL